MDHERLLIGSISDHDGLLVVACRSCGWTSWPVASGRECGEQWDGHLASVHAFAPSDR